MPRNDESQSDQESQVQAQPVEQPKCSTTEQTRGPKVHRRTPRPCPQWLAEGGLVGLRIKVSFGTKSVTLDIHLLPGTGGGEPGACSTGRDSRGGGGGAERSGSISKSEITHQVAEECVVP